jgi:hypothetical protein
VGAENPVHGSGQEGCDLGRSAVMITAHVSAVRVPSGHAGRRVAAAVAARGGVKEADGTITLVTGANRGLGLETARLGEYAGHYNRHWPPPVPPAAPDQKTRTAAPLNAEGTLRRDQRVLPGCLAES